MDKKKDQWALYMAGGISYNEMSHVERTVSQDEEAEVSFITDAVYTPESFIETLAKLPKI